MENTFIILKITQTADDNSVNKKGLKGIIIPKCP